MRRGQRPSRISRSIEPKYWERASQVRPELIGPYLDDIVTTLHISLDKWRFSHGPVDDVELALDAFIALWTAVPSR